ncbi:hypothetical protein A0H81_05090 [Grifola frondosa]|uniref:Uncharacterized protein n=1 Tax=Grifola frondosa TaxID=5627 RepID=A0A1C7MDY4_GRIFR|nr:hypothetical protein A0H81_05090 [Grifola frondosa]
MAIALDRAELVSLFLESLLVGSFFVLYGIAVWILMFRSETRKRTTLNRMLFAIASTMFILTVAHLGIDLHRAIEGFIVFSHTPEGAIGFFLTLSDPTHVGKNVIYSTQTLVGDGFVVYRLYVVWNRNLKIIIFPIMLLVADGVAAYAACYEFSVSGTDPTKLGDIFVTSIKPWLTSAFVLSLCTNVVSTSLIAGRIWYSNRRLARYHSSLGSSNWRVIEILIQSAVLYSASLIALLTTYLANSNAQYICLDATQPIIAIAFTLIIIRVGISTKDFPSHPPSSNSRISASVSAQHEYPLRPVPVAITVSVARHQERSSFDQYGRDGKADDAESGSSLVKPTGRVRVQREDASELPL